MSDLRGNFGILSANCFTGSLVGQPPLVFAVMCYAVANARPYDDEEHGVVGTLEIHPQLLALIFKVTPDEVSAALDYLCQPDPRSRSKTADGRRLIDKGSFRYHLVNMARYRKAEAKEALRETWRENKRRQRRKARETVSENCPGQNMDSPEDTGHPEESPSVPLTSSSSLSPLSSTSTPKKRRPPFAEWWDRWPSGPLRKDRARCENAWKQMAVADCEAALADIAPRAAAWAEHDIDMHFEKRPLTFLRAKGWEDPLPERRSERGSGRLTADGNMGRMPHSGFDKKDYGESGDMI